MRQRSLELAQLGRRALEADATVEPTGLAAFEEAAARYGTPSEMRWDELLGLAAAVAGWRCDLKAYSYLAIAAFACGGEHRYAALADALVAYRDIVAEGWARCVPPEPYREDQITFVSEQLAAMLAAAPAKESEAAELRACVAAAERLAEAAGEALGLGRPVLYELRQVLAGQAQAFPVPEPEPVISEGETASAAVTNVPAVELEETATSDHEPARTRPAGAETAPARTKPARAETAPAPAETETAPEPAQAPPDPPPSPTDDIAEPPEPPKPIDQAPASDTSNTASAQLVDLVDPEPPLPIAFRPRLEALQARLNRTASGRARFLVRLDIARHCVSGGRVELALPLVDALLGDVDAYDLREWEPDLVVETLKLACEAARLGGRDAETRAALWRRLCELSPCDAESLGPQAAGR